MDGLVTESAVKAAESAPQTQAWQWRLLPLMASMLVMLAIFIGAANLYQAHRLLGYLESAQQVDLRHGAGTMPLDKAATFADQLASADLRTRVALESHALQSRYHQATVVMMCRVYIVFLGFATGMVLAVVGAAFVLGKIHEPVSDLSAGSSSFRIALQSSSPGLFLALLGSALIVATIWAPSRVDVKDDVVYMSGGVPALAAPAQAGENAPAANAASKALMDRLNKVRKEELEKAQTPNK